ncbi:hypothetical protein, partial [Paenibacillus alba]|uniref:hypothetical protein n=1 Tax=Paenibacillus alba TaxID=1197127 RepID=UPI001C20BEF4
VSWVDEQRTAPEPAKKAVSGGESGRTEQKLSCACRNGSLRVEEQGNALEPAKKAVSGVKSGRTEQKMS